jgi:putative redox protein
MTVRMYADRKGWPLEQVRVTLRHSRIHAEDCAHCETTKGWIDHIDKDIELIGELDDTQRQRLLQIAERCPVQQTLTSEVDVASSGR